MTLVSPAYKLNNKLTSHHKLNCDIDPNDQDSPKSEVVKAHYNLGILMETTWDIGEHLRTYVETANG